MKIPSQVLAFAGGESNIAPYKMFVDYFNHFRALNGATNVEYQKLSIDKETGKEFEVSYAEKGDKLNAAIKREIMRIAGISDMSALPIEAWQGHPTLRWATFAVVGAMIDMVLPESIIDSIGLYSDVRVIGWGDSASFDLMPRDLFVVSKAGKAKRTTELHKQFIGQVTVMPELREMTVFVNMMKVLAGKESLAELVVKMVRSFETQLSYDVYNAFATAMAAVDATASTGLLASGYTQAEFLRLSQTVTAWNGGARAVAVGTQVALGSIMPTNANYRYDIDSEFVKLGYIRNFLGTDVMVLPQIADWATPFGLKLANDKIWIISPSSQKLVKVILEGSVLSHTTDFYDHANLVQTSTMAKSWGTAIATTSVAAQISL